MDRLLPNIDVEGHHHPDAIATAPAAEAERGRTEDDLTSV
jgi:hypothetical protein